MKHRDFLIKSDMPVLSYAKYRLCANPGDLAQEVQSLILRLFNYGRLPVTSLMPLLLVMIWSLPLGAQTLPLSLQNWNWNQPLELVEGIPASMTAHFSATGKEISVGPWIAGNARPRLEYLESLPLREGSIHGKFHTENLYPREANIWITYKRGNERLTELNFWLGVTDKWESFSFPIIAPPPGCDAIALSFGFGMKTHGRVYLTDLQIGGPLVLPDLPDPKPRLTRVVRPESFKPGSSVRLKTVGKTSWLVDANGKPFFSLGSAMYGNRMKPEETFPAFHDLGLNTIANGSDLKQWSAFNDKQVVDHAPVAFQFYRVNSVVGGDYNTLVDADGNNPGMSQEESAKIGGFNHAFPDPFDPRWEASAREQIRETALLFKNKPYFMAWMASNERTHYNLYNYVWSPDCTIKFGLFLEKKYVSIDALNKAWKSHYSSFADLLKQKPQPLVIEGAKYEDFRLFSREILRTFNETILRIIHEEDPGRLVFTNRFMIHEVRGVFDNLDLYKGFDGIAVNIYPSNAVWGFDKGEREYLTLLHTLTGKPLIICEWSVPARDSKLYDNPARLDWSYPQTVATQQQRASHSARVLAELYNMPFVVGAHWFSWADFDSKQRQSNRGLFKANNQPWPELQEALKDLIIRMEVDSRKGAK
jgi:hypothetical protein